MGATRFCEVLKIRGINHLFNSAISYAGRLRHRSKIIVFIGILRNFALINMSGKDAENLLSRRSLTVFDHSKQD